VAGKRAAHAACGFPPQTSSQSSSKHPQVKYLKLIFAKKKILEIEIQLWQHFCPEASATRKRPLPIGVN
jgi:hypothetical protein